MKGFKKESGHRKKTAAQKAADIIRKKGYKARVVEKASGWAVLKGGKYKAKTIKKPQIKKAPKKFPISYDRYKREAPTKDFEMRLEDYLNKINGFKTKHHDIAEHYGSIYYQDEWDEDEIVDEAVKYSKRKGLTEPSKDYEIWHSL